MSRNAVILTAGFNASAYSPTEWVQQTWRPAIEKCCQPVPEIHCFNHDDVRMAVKLRDLLIDDYTVYLVGHSYGGAAVIDAGWMVVNPAWEHYKPLPFGSVIAGATLLDPVPNPARGQAFCLDLSPIVLYGKAYVCESPVSLALKARANTVRKTEIVRLTHSGVTTSTEILVASMGDIRMAFGQGVGKCG